jgi:DMSO/TMAO reductase YedYZ molybdopterin-dependent catalytic subunit
MIINNYRGDADSNSSEEENMKRLVILIISIGLLLCVGCSSEKTAAIENNDNPTELESVEIREYEGERLASALTGWRENSIMGPQHIDTDSYKLRVTGLVERLMAYTYDEVLERNKYSKVVTLYCVEGWSKKILWEGILVRDLLNEAGVKPEANTVIFHAEDGYTTSLPLDFIIENDILLAHKMNGVTIPVERGYPFELVAEAKLGYKWIKWVTEIELSDDPDYRGFWEQRGYDNDADVGG